MPRTALSDLTEPTRETVLTHSFVKLLTACEPRAAPAVTARGTAACRVSATALPIAAAVAVSQTGLAGGIPHQVLVAVFLAGLKAMQESI